MRPGAKLKIGVIGAGAVGTATLYELFSQFKDNLPKVFLIDGGGQWGRGNVYLDDLACAMVNRQAKHMSLLYDDQYDFLRWVEQNPNEVGPIVDRHYFTRATFGKYLEQRLAAIEKLWSDAGAMVERIEGFVERFEEISDTVQIGLPANKLEVDYLILCTGHGPCRPPGQRAGGMLSPYPLSDLCTAIRGLNRVAIIGTGLTAVDCALALLRDDICARVSMFSRSGMIPDLRADFEEDLPLTLPERTDHVGATLEEMEKRFMAELAAQNVSLAELLRYMAKLRRGVRNLFDPMPAAESSWRIQNLSISIANRDLPTYWHGFSDHDRQVFYDRYYRFVQTVTAPIPVSTAHLLRNAIATGQLEIRVGTAEHVGGLVRIHSSTGLETYDAVVDATGKRTSAGQVEFEKMLVTAGAAVAEHYGGIRVDQQSGRIKQPANTSSRVYAAGYVTRGSLLYSSSLYQATRNIKKIVASIRAAVNGEAQYEPHIPGRHTITAPTLCNAPAPLHDGRHRDLRGRTRHSVQPPTEVAVP